MTTCNPAHWQGSFFPLSSAFQKQSDSNLLRQGFETWIKDCVLTKKEQVSFTQTIVRMSVCFLFQVWRKVCISFSKWGTATAVTQACFCFWTNGLKFYFMMSWLYPFWVPIHNFSSYTVKRVHPCLIASRRPASKDTKQDEDNHFCLVISACNESQMCLVTMTCG